MHGSAEPSRSSTHGINLEIEYLRAVAILLVVMTHATSLFPAFRVGSWTGVDLFFCISGYVISRAFLPYFDLHIAEGRWWTAARAFWVRRAFRLVPAAWTWLAIMVFCSYAFNRSGHFQPFADNLRTAGYFLTFTTNVMLPTGAVTSNGFLWSLTLEDQFYFVFPFLLLLVRGQWRWKLLLLLIFLQFLPNRSQLTNPLPSLLWTLRLDALMWGVLIFMFSRSEVYRLVEPTSFRKWYIALPVSVALIYALHEIPRGELGPWLGYHMESHVAVVSALLVFFASYQRGYVLPLFGWMQALLKWIGARSYGLYLIHPVVFNGASEVWFRTGGAGTERPLIYAAAIVAVTAALAELSFRLLETPMRKRGVRIASRILMKNANAPAPAE
jgi:peptidoglycan/LPS O-acetylase OafA/YrhL